METTITTKICTRCKIEKPSEAFTKSTRYKSGLVSRCKGCQVELSTAWNKAHPERYREIKSSSSRRITLRNAPPDARRFAYSPDRSEKRCPRCKERKPIDQFSPVHEPTGVRVPYCKSCQAERFKEWKEKNPEVLAASQLKFKLENPDKPREAVMKHRASLTLDQRQQIERSSTLKKKGMDERKYEVMLKAQGGAVRCAARAIPMADH